MARWISQPATAFVEPSRPATIVIIAVSMIGLEADVQTPMPMPVSSVTCRTNGRWGCGPRRSAAGCAVPRSRRGRVRRAARRRGRGCRPRGGPWRSDRRPAAPGSRAAGAPRPAHRAASSRRTAASGRHPGRGLDRCRGSDGRLVPHPAPLPRHHARMAVHRRRGRSTRGPATDWPPREAVESRLPACCGRAMPAATPPRAISKPPAPAWPLPGCRSSTDRG